MFRHAVITGVSVSHERATIEEIEAAASEETKSALAGLLTREPVREAFVIQTCNRAEAYVVTEHAPDGRSILDEYVADVREGAVVRMDHETSLRHLMRVAAGLESMVLGEDQIIGQFRTAVDIARGEGALGPVFEEALTKAIRVGERARSETTVNEGAVSIGSAAVELAAREIDLDGATALVLGAGEMATLAARSLDSAGVDRMIVANRTIPNAEGVLDTLETGGRAVGIDAAAAAAESADVIVAATGSPDYVIEADDVNNQDGMVCVDIAQPRDIDPALEETDGISVYDIDAIDSVTEDTHERRAEAAAKVEELIDEEFDRLVSSFKRKRADEAIRSMYESAEAIKRRELGTALTKLESDGELTDEQRETIEALCDAIVGQLLAAPTKSLREAAAEDDWTTIQTALALFDPEFDGPPRAIDRQGWTATPEEATADGDAEVGVGLSQDVLDRLGDD